MSDETLMVPGDIEGWSAERTLEVLVRRFHPRLYIACSFQKEASVIMDMMSRIEPEARFFTLDTGLLFPETYETWARLERRYGFKVEPYRGITLAQQADEHGSELWAADPDRCCSLRKVAPLRRALEGVDAWIAGTRRSQSPERRSTPKLHWDAPNCAWKANPLADWTERSVLDYLHTHGVPYNELHDHGYASIGCLPCTRAGSGREGRWPDYGKTECGLHSPPQAS